MIKDKGIPIKNVYYMLTYAFNILRRDNYEKIEGESFEDIYDLFAEILKIGLSYLLKQGLHREYICVNETLPTLRGKLDMPQVIREKMNCSTRLACEYDVLSENNVFNQILKTAVCRLLKHSDVQKERKQALRKLMLFFSEVDELENCDIVWSKLKYDRNTRTYQMLHTLCYFLLDSELLSTDSGDKKMARFSDDHMNLLFQRFVLEYYKRRFPECHAYPKQIRWDLSSTGTDSSQNILPIMQTDIYMTLGERHLIIDTKYYSHTLYTHYDKKILHSNNFYQIQAYVLNEDFNHTGKVDGMLLYARTEETLQPDMQKATHDGNIFMVRTLDLNCEFKDIKNQLNKLIGYFPTTTI